MADTAARLAISARRNEVARFTIAVTGIDMTGVPMAMQIRLGRDVPGAPLIALATVNTLAAEGLKLDGVTVTNGVLTSIIKGRINASTMTDATKVPYMGEVGTDSVLAYAMQWTLNGDPQTRLYGDFVVLGSAFGSDGAPTNRPPSYGGSATSGGSNSGSLTFGDQVIQVVISDAAIVGALIGQATNAKEAAETARDITKGWANQAQATVQPFSLSAVQTIGRPSDPVAEGSQGSVSTFIALDPLRAGPFQIKIMSPTASGTYQILRMSKSGANYAVTAVSNPVVVTAAGLLTLTATELGAAFATAAEGEYLAIKCSGAAALFYTDITRDGAGWGALVNLPATVGATTTMQATYANRRFQAQITVSYSVQNITGAAFDALQKASAAQAAIAALLMGPVSQVIGIPAGTSLVDGTTIDSNTYISQAAVIVPGSLKSFSLYAHASGTVTISTYVKNGTAVSRVNSVTVNVPTAGAATFTAADFGDLPVAAGQYLGYSGAGVICYTNGTPDWGGTWFTPAASGTANVGTLNVPARFQLSVTLTGIAQVVTADAFLAQSNQTLSLANVDKIAIAGNSYNDFFYGVPGKAPACLASSLSEYNFANVSQSGATMATIAGIVANGTARFGASFEGYNPRYAVITEQQNSKITTSQTDAQYYADTQAAIDAVRSFGVTPIIMSEWGGEFPQVIDGEQRNLRGMRAMADKNGLLFIDATSKTRTMNARQYAPFFKNAHPATRSAWMIIEGMRQGLKQLPRPTRSLKIFRVRGTTTVSSVNDLMFRHVEERHRLFRELFIGHTAVAVDQYSNYDTSTAGGSQIVNDEYIALAKGTATALGVYALVDAVLPVTGPKGLSVTLPDAAITVYARKMSAAGSTWVQLAGTAGVYSIPATCIDQDRVALLLYKAGGISLNASPVLSWTGGSQRNPAAPMPVAPPKGAELLTQPLTVVAGAIPAAWVNPGALPVVASGYDDNITPAGTTGCVEVTSANPIQQQFTVASSDDPTEIAVRVWCRFWRPIFNPSGDYSTAPITGETCDTATLQVTISGQGGITRASAVRKTQVGLYWCELEFRSTIEALNTTALIDVRSSDLPIEIVKVSVKSA